LVENKSHGCTLSVLDFGPLQLEQF